MARITRPVSGLAGLACAGAVIIGSFGAHAAPSAQVEEWLHTAAFWLLASGLGALIAAGRGAPRAGGLLLAGGAIFTFALVGLAAGGPAWFGAIAPVGGVSMIAGFIALGVTLGTQAG